MTLDLLEVGNPVVRHRRLNGYVSSLLSFEIPILIQDASVINENFDLFIISITLPNFAILTLHQTDGYILHHL